MGKRCQVCDGPIVNGRCKYCGMPYRNDMELYHLNEDRSEHYRHASAKERKVMAESEIPLPDRNKTANKSSKTSTVKKTVPKSKTQKVQSSVKKTSAKQNTGIHTYNANRNPVQERKKEKKSKKGATVFWILVVILMSIAAQTEEYWDSIGYRIESFINDEFGIDPGSIFSDSDAEGINEKSLDNDNKVSKVAESTKAVQSGNPDTYIFAGESYVVGESYIVTGEDSDDTEDMEYEFSIEPGEYKIESAWEEVALEIKYTTGKKKTVKFDEAGHQEKIELHAGDEVSVVALDGQVNYLTLYEIQQYDE